MCAEDGSWLFFRSPREVIVSRSLAEVMPALHRVERFVEQGWFAAGFISYEAAPAFDSSLAAHAPDSFPLLRFGIYPPPAAVRRLPAVTWDGVKSVWRSSVSREVYEDAVCRIREYISRGDTYQVNFTFRLHTRFDDDAWDCFCSIAGHHPMPHAAYIDAGRYKICSFSPECFFRLHRDMITVKPMKGTAARGRFNGEDLERRIALQTNGKERAENVMIVDMLRNDLGRIAVNGSVNVSSLCGVESFRTVLQMVSTIGARTNEPLHRIFSALFPCASITGAPKVRTSRIIRELESTPRHIYCGTVGWVAPQRHCLFNVAIRTLLIDGQEKTAEFGTGGGIIWDSDSRREYEECAVKARIVTSPQPSFSLVETLLWSPSGGYFLLERHLDRLIDSAQYFSFPVDMEYIRHKLYAAADRFGRKERQRVRLLVDCTGKCIVNSTTLPDYAQTDREILELYPAAGPVRSDDCFLFHKTTFRSQYDDMAKRFFPDGGDLLFYNEKGEITETTIGNVVVRVDGELYTPAVCSGLLAGVFRAELISAGKIREKVLTMKDLAESSAIYRINSVRLWQSCRLAGNGCAMIFPGE